MQRSDARRAFSHVVGIVAIIALYFACDSGSPAAPNGDAGTTPDAGGADSGLLDAAFVDGDVAPRPFGLDVRPKNATCLAPPPPTTSSGSVPRVRFDWYRTPALASPIQARQAPNDPTRWFVALRDGRLVTISAAAPTDPPTVVANLSDLSGVGVATNGEGGFLGFAFHPRFSDNGRVYVTWTSSDVGPGLEMKSRVGFITTPNNGASFTSYTNLLTFDQPNLMHKGGGIAFGKDNFLYLSFGDGGIGGSAQNRNNFYAKVLRIDVDNAPSGSTYGIPSGNPFQSGGGEPATFAWGFRNPFRISIDRATGQLWLGDVGDSRWEEVDRVESGGNYGWPCREASHDFSGQHPVACPLGVTNLLEPIIEHEHVPNVSPSRSITGGVVYRGRAIPSMVGTYVYGDIATNEIFALTYERSRGLPKTRVLNPNGPNGGWVDFAEDVDGEILAVDFYGYLYRMVPADDLDAGTIEPVAAPFLSQTGCVDASDPSRPAQGLIPFDVNLKAAAGDGTTVRRWLALPDDARIHVTEDSELSLPPGSVLIQTFERNAKPVETRMLVRHADATWSGFSYEWEGSDARLLLGSKRTFGTNAWYFPSSAECMTCHGERTPSGAGVAFGFEPAQLNRDYDFSLARANQLDTFDHIGLFDRPLRSTELPKLASAEETNLEAKARALLHVNCAPCHQPPQLNRSEFDVRWNTPLSAMNVCNRTAMIGDLEIATAKLLTPGSASTSLLSIRARRSDAHQMPPFPPSMHMSDPELSTIDQWINALPGSTCAQ